MDDYDLDDNDNEQIDRFLSAISQVESSGGKDLAHREVKSGIQAGDRAIGRYALMPNTVQEMANRMSREGSADEEVEALRRLPSDQIREKLEGNEPLQKTIATRLAKHVLRDTDDPRQAAYRWTQGHNTPLERITEEQMEGVNKRKSDYINRFSQKFEEPSSTETKDNSNDNDNSDQASTLKGLINKFGHEAVAKIVPGLAKLSNLLIPEARADEFESTPEMEKYKEWAETQKSAAKEAERAAQFESSEIARHAEAAKRPISTLGEAMKRSQLEKASPPYKPNFTMVGEPKSEFQVLPPKLAKKIQDRAKAALGLSPEEMLINTPESPVGKFLSRYGSILGKSVGAAGAGVSIYDLKKSMEKDDKVGVGTNALNLAEAAALMGGSTLAAPLGAAALAGNLYRPALTEFLQKTPEDFEYDRKVKVIDYIKNPEKFDNLPPVDKAQLEKDARELQKGMASSLVARSGANITQDKQTGMADSLAARSGSDIAKDQQDQSRPMGMADSLAARSGADLSKDQQTLSELEKETEDKQEEKQTAQEKITELLKSTGAIESDYARQSAEARRASSMGVLGAQIGEAAAKLGAGIAGAAGKGIVKTPEVDTKAFETQMGLALKLPEQVKEKMEMDRYDPSSEISRSTREFAKETLKINIPDNISAAVFKEHFPAIEKYLQAKEAAKERAARAEQAAALRATLSGEKMDLQKTNRAVKSLEKLKDRLMNAGGQVGKDIRQAILRADNMFDTLLLDRNISPEEALKFDPTKLNDNNKLAVVETAIELNRLLAGSNVPGQKTLEKLIPDNVKTKKTSAKDFFFSKLNPAEQGEFLKQAVSIAARIRQNAQERNDKFAEFYLRGTKNIQEILPEDYADVLEGQSVSNPFKTKKKPPSSKGKISKEGFEKYFNNNKKMFENKETAIKHLEAQGFYVER